MDQAKSIYSFWFFNRVNRNLFFWATKDASLNVADIKTSSNHYYLQKISNYFQIIKMISTASMDMRCLLAQWCIHLIIIWWRNMQILLCLMWIVKNMGKWMKCFVLLEAVLLKNHQDCSSSICTKVKGKNQPKWKFAFFCISQVTMIPFRKKVLRHLYNV